MTWIKFRNLSENSPYLLAALGFLSWLLQEIFSFFLLSSNEALVILIKSTVTMAILVAFGLFTIVVLIAYLINKKFKRFFWTIALMVIVSVFTQFIDRMLFPYKLKNTTSNLGEMFKRSHQKAMGEKEAILEKEQVIFNYHYEGGNNSIRISQVAKNGFGAKLNLAAGDILKTLNGEEINVLNKAFAILPGLRCSTESKLTIQRGIRSYTIPLTPDSQLTSDDRKRQVVKVFNDGNLRSCHEHIGLSEEQLERLIKNCRINKQKCSATDDKSCSLEGADLECVRGRVEDPGDPFRIVMYPSSSPSFQPASFLKCQCNKK